jgi:hypothetical protein
MRVSVGLGWCVTSVGAWPDSLLLQHKIGNTAQKSVWRKRTNPRYNSNVRLVANAMKSGSPGKRAAFALVNAQLRFCHRSAEIEWMPSAPSVEGGLERTPTVLKTKSGCSAAKIATASGYQNTNLERTAPTGVAENRQAIAQIAGRRQHNTTVMQNGRVGRFATGIVTRSGLLRIWSGKQTLGGAVVPHHTGRGGPGRSERPSESVTVGSANRAGWIRRSIKVNLPRSCTFTTSPQRGKWMTQRCAILKTILSHSAGVATKCGSRWHHSGPILATRRPTDTAPMTPRGRGHSPSKSGFSRNPPKAPSERKNHQKSP